MLRLGESFNPGEQFFFELSADIQADYERTESVARNDAQRAGHAAETVWEAVLQKWLPPAYEVGTRKYIVSPFSVDPPADPTETDIVVFNPSYPVEMRQRTDILAGGVAAAFCVRRTADADGIRDAAHRAARLKRESLTSLTARRFLQGAYPVGLLANSHSWKAAGSQPHENITRNLLKHKNDCAEIPADVLDFCCIADLGFWSETTIVRTPFTDPPAASRNCDCGGVISLMTFSQKLNAPELPVASFLIGLTMRLAYTNPQLQSWAMALGNTRPERRYENPLESCRTWPVSIMPAELLARYASLSRSPAVKGELHDWQALFW